MTSFFFNRHQSESQSSFHQSSVRLSEISFNQNIMIRQKFPSTFKKQLWDQISSNQPYKFLAKQKKILETLLNNEEKFTLFFKQFYQNHKKIYEWCILANQKHLEIKQYVFSKLLKKSILQYKIQLRENLANKTKKSLKKDQNFNQNKFYGSSSNNSLINQSNKMQNKMQMNESLPNSFHKSSTFSSQVQNSNEDYYQLFMKTLDACEGSKYIHYDFRKHQKGYENRNFYNNFIRSKNTDKQNLNQDKFLQSLKRFKNKKSSFHQNLPSKMSSVIQQNKSNDAAHHSSFSNFQMLTIQDDYDSFQNNEKSIKTLGKKDNKKLVLKKMPHRFGNQKSVSDFIIKTQKPLFKNK